MKIIAGAYSSKGCVREHNEDAFLLASETGGGGVEDALASFAGSVDACLLFAVADGMGGHEAGDRASAFVVRNLLEATPQFAGIEAADMERTIIAVHKSLLVEAQQCGATNMGSTLTGIAIQHGLCGFYNVGDSRVYRLRNGFLQQLSHDDSLSQFVPGAAKNIITNAVGAGIPNITVEYRFSESIAISGDVFCMCSDGVHGFVKDDDLEKMLAGQFSPVETARRVVEQAIENSSDDNCTAVIVRIEG
jgi:serine/threonine protein phosphatase PrpC